MADDFLGSLLGSAARARVIRVFVFNQNEPFTLGQLSRRAGIRPLNAQREIRFLEKLGVVKKGKLVITLPGGREVRGKQKEQSWILNLKFKHMPALSKFIHEVSPIHHNHIVLALRKAGRLSAVILSGSFMGDPSRPADLIVATDVLNERRIEQAMRVLEPQLGREIRYAAFSTPEFRYRLTIQDRLIRDTLDYPHLVLLDKTRLL